RLVEPGVAHRVDRLVRRQGDAGGVRRRDVGVLTPGGERRGDDPLRSTLVGDAGDVIGAHAACTFGNVQIFAAQLDALCRQRVVAIRVGQPAVPLDMLAVPV